MIRLYDYLPSGNGYKVRLALRQLGIPFELVELDITRGETRTPDFLALNPNGRIPLVELEPGRTLAESHAILWYFAEDSKLVPQDRYQRALVWQGLCFEQYSLEPFIGVARFWLHAEGRTPAELGARLEEKLEGGHRALGVLDQGLRGREFLVEDRYTLADLALYAYTHVAEEGGFELAGYPAVLDWFERVRSQPGHVPISDDSR